MKAIYKDFYGKINRSHRKEKHFLSEYSAFIIENNSVKNVAVCRIYGTQAMNYACIWFHTGTHTAGSGSAGGYGYHRPSAAAEIAFKSAGFKLSEDIAGRGDGAIQKALEACVKSLCGRKRVYIHYAHA